MDREIPRLRFESSTESQKEVSWKESFRLLVTGYDPVLQGEGDRFGAGGHSQFAKNAADMKLSRGVADEELLSHLLIAETLNH